MTAPSDVEISIVNHENRALLRRCLESLPGACDGLAWHVTVVDNVSNDGSIEMLAREFPSVDVLCNTTRRGFGANHNQVLRQVLLAGSARYVLVLNDDTELAPGAVRQLVELMSTRSLLAAAGPTVQDERGRPFTSRVAYPSLRSSVCFDLSGVPEGSDDCGGWLQGCCLLLRCEALSEVGLFDERYFLFYEDTDLSRRFVEAGWSLATCAEATITHRGHSTVLRPELAAFTAKQGLRSRYLYFRKHGRPLVAALVAASPQLIHGGRATRLVVGAALRGQRADALAVAREIGLARHNSRRPLVPKPVNGYPEPPGPERARRTRSASTGRGCIVPAHDRPLRANRGRP